MAVSFAVRGDCIKFASIMRKIYLITGGERSGKSVYAERLALSLSPHPIYLATARIWDAEFRTRVDIHRARRGACWENIEEEKLLSRHQVEGRTVLIDCLTLWATNYFFDRCSCGHAGGDEQARAEAGVAEVNDTLDALKQEFERFTAQDATFIFVTNEIGMGGVSPNETQRRFTDLLGWFNQYVAQQAHEVVLMVSGIPVPIKHS